MQQACVRSRINLVFCDYLRCPHRNCEHHCSRIKDLFASHNFDHFPGTPKCPRHIAASE